MKKTAIVVTFLSFVVSLVGMHVAHAAGDSGCGLGSMIIQKNAKVSQTLAATTNATLLTQLFGITSGTSNCTSNSMVMVEQEAVMFADANFQTLKVELARGEGESVRAMAELVGCKEHTQSFGASAKAQYSALFQGPNTTSADLVKSLKAVCLASQG